MGIEQLINREEYKRRQGVIYDCMQQNTKELNSLLCANFINSDEYMLIFNRMTKFYEERENLLDKEFNV